MKRFPLKKVRIPKLGRPKLPKIPFISLKVPAVFKYLQEKPKKILFLSFLAIGLGFAMTMLLVIQGTDDTPLFPEPGVYYAKLIQDAGLETLTTGQRPEDSRQHQTLNLIVSGARINNFYLENVQVGASGLNESILLTGGSNNTITCEWLIIDGLVAPTLTISDGEAYNLIVTGNVADGNSFSATLNNSVSSISFGSTRGSLDIPGVSNSDFDRIVIDTSAADSTCNTLTFKDVRAFGAGVELSDFRVGTLYILNSRIGDGSGINSPSFIIEDLKASVIEISNNTEEPIDVR
jgi:hypothetical protein